MSEAVKGEDRRSEAMGICRIYRILNEYKKNQESKTIQMVSYSRVSQPSSMRQPGEVTPDLPVALGNRAGCSANLSQTLIWLSPVQARWFSNSAYKLSPALEGRRLVLAGRALGRSRRKHYTFHFIYRKHCTAGFLSESTQFSHAGLLKETR